MITEIELRRGQLYWWCGEDQRKNRLDFHLRTWPPAVWPGLARSVLRKAGHSVICLDLARQALDESAVREADLIAIYLPMHTATRLASQLLPNLRAANPRAHVCCYGLYAPMNAEYLRSLGVATVLGGEFENNLLHLAERLTQANGNGGSRHPARRIASVDGAVEV